MGEWNASTVAAAITGTTQPAAAVPLPAPQATEIKGFIEEERALAEITQGR